MLKVPILYPQGQPSKVPILVFPRGTGYLDLTFRQDTATSRPTRKRKDSCYHAAITEEQHIDETSNVVDDPVPPKQQRRKTRSSRKGKEKAVNSDGVFVDDSSSNDDSEPDTDLDRPVDNEEARFQIHLPDIQLTLFKACRFSCLKD